MTLLVDSNDGGDCSTVRQSIDTDGDSLALGGTMPASPGRLGIPVLPALTLPDPEDVAASREAAPIFGMFRRLVEFVGPGRKLTAKGNPTLADAKALVELLGTGDVVDEQVGGHTFITTSAEELPRLHQVFTWAQKAGIVRIAGRKVVVTKRGPRLADGSAASFDRAVKALLAIGPLTSQRPSDGILAWSDVDTFLDGAVVHLLPGPYVARRPVPIEEITGIAVEAVLASFQFRALKDEHVAKRVMIDVVDMVDALALAGIVRRVGTGEIDVVAGHRRYGGAVELTPAGIVVAHRLLVDAGYDTPIAGELDTPASELRPCPVGPDLSFGGTAEVA